MRRFRDGLRSSLQQRRWLLLALGFAAIVATYIFFVSAGRLFTKWPTYATFLDDQAEGFRAGHLHLAIEPSRALLSKADPFDPAWRSLWYWDASLYNGHYYLYWGPLPALLLAVFKTVFRIHARVGDQYVVFGLACVQALAGMLLIHRVQRRLFPALPGVFVVLAVAVFAFANPTPYNLARAGVYEAAIIGGHAFLVAGLLFAFEAISRVGRQRSLLLLAGFCWALALGCRASIAPGVLSLVAATCWFVALPGTQRWQQRALALGWVGTPLAVGVACLLTYNKLRFDAWFDFGAQYQLTWIPVDASTAFLLANAWSYTLRPLVLDCTFPFISAVTGMGASAFPSWLRQPTGYIVYEPVIGWLPALPWAWLAPIAVMIGIRPDWAFGGSRAAADAVSVALTWLVVATALAAITTFVVPLSWFWATMRYLGDAAPALTLLGTWGWWLVHARFRDWPLLRRSISTGAIALALATVAIGAALGFDGQYEHFRQHNPALLDRLEKGLSVCDLADKLARDGLQVSARRSDHGSRASLKPSLASASNASARAGRFAADGRGQSAQYEQASRWRLAKSVMVSG